MQHFTVTTKQPKQVIDITDQITELLAKQPAKDGVCSVFVQHTTTALTTADLDPGTDLDMLDAFEAMIPKLQYRHPHDPSHAPDHILSALIGTSVQVPVENGRLKLGTWQRVVLFEFTGPQERQLALAFTPER